MEYILLIKNINVIKDIQRLIAYYFVNIMINKSKLFLNNMFHKSANRHILDIVYFYNRPYQCIKCTMYHERFYQIYYRYSGRFVYRPSITVCFKCFNEIDH